MAHENVQTGLFRSHPNQARTVNRGSRLRQKSCERLSWAISHEKGQKHFFFLAVSESSLEHDLSFMTATKCQEPEKLWDIARENGPKLMFSCRPGLGPDHDNEVSTARKILELRKSWARAHEKGQKLVISSHAGIGHEP